ncbi:MAG: nucleotide exchange factor GrpE [Deltaproteobacteria bacterium]|nr:MAG: nucleotide exchange factor GrpE [Deltaproteobacteria bacterium]
MNKNVKEKNKDETIEVTFSDKENKVKELHAKRGEAERKEAKKTPKAEKKDWKKEYQDLYDKYIRLHAEFENFKRRITKDKQDAIRFANQELIRQILPFVDNLERSLEHADEVKNIDALKEGIEMTIKDFLKTLEKSGLEAIPAEGEPFDPNVHEAIMQEERNDLEPNTVVQELQRGYKLHGRVIRPATVTVSKKKDS